MCDLGLGNGLRNKLTESLAKKDYNLAQSLVSSTYILLSIIIIPICVVLLSVTSFVDFNSVLNISSDIVSAVTLQRSIKVLIVGVAVNFVLKTINSILYAMQLSSVNNVISLFVSAIPLIFIAVYKTTSVDNDLIVLSYCHAFSINIPLVITSLIVFFNRKLSFMRPKIASVDVRVAKSTLNLGMSFFVAQIFFMFLFSTNEVFISKLYSPENVVEYNIYYRLFMIIGSIFMVGLTPVWSKVTKDIAENRLEKIKTINKILLFVSELAVFANIILVIFLQFVINIWLRDRAFSVNYFTAVIFAFLGSIYIFNIVLTTIANGIGNLKTQICFYGIGAILKIPVCYLLESIGVGWQGIIAYNSIVLAAFCAFQYIWINNYLDELSVI